MQQSGATVANSVDGIGDKSIRTSKMVLIVAQATRCMKIGCESFLVMVHNNVADATADQQTVDNDNRIAVPERAEHIAASQRAYADVFVAPSGLPS